MRRRQKNLLITSSPGIEAMKQEAGGNKCIACDGPLPQRCRVLCKDPECRSFYQKAYSVDRRAGYKTPRRMMTPRTELDLYRSVEVKAFIANALVSAKLGLQKLRARKVRYSAEVDTMVTQALELALNEIHDPANERPSDDES